MGTPGRRIFVLHRPPSLARLSSMFGINSFKLDRAVRLDSRLTPQSVVQRG